MSFALHQNFRFFGRRILLCVLLGSAVASAHTALAQPEGGLILADPGETEPSLGVQQAEDTDFQVRPSVITSTLGQGEQTLELVAFCFDPATGTLIPNCDITLELEARPFTGGHDHHDNDRPPGEFDPAQGNTGDDGILETTYTAPEVSGVIDVTVLGEIDGSPTVPGFASIGVRIPGLVGLPIRGAGFEVLPSDFHANDNRFATPSVVERLEGLPQAFEEKAQESLGENFEAVPILFFTSIGLPEGGLLDFRATWLPPHSSHRFGEDADLGVNDRILPMKFRRALERAIRANGFFFPVALESPANPDINHWHLRAR